MHSQQLGRIERYMQFLIYADVLPDDVFLKLVA
jgi:hypothetical protein